MAERTPRAEVRLQQSAGPEFTLCTVQTVPHAHQNQQATIQQLLVTYR